jgi:hypothetical protein
MPLNTTKRTTAHSPSAQLLPIGPLHPLPSRCYSVSPQSGHFVTGVCVRHQTAPPECRVPRQRVYAPVACVSLRPLAHLAACTTRCTLLSACSTPAVPPGCRLYCPTHDQPSAAPPCHAHVEWVCPHQKPAIPVRCSGAVRLHGLSLGIPDRNIHHHTPFVDCGPPL